VLGGGLFGPVAPAQAHNYLISSTPTVGGTLTELPSQFEVTTNGPLLTLGGSTAGFAMEIRDAAGLYYGDGCVSVSGPSVLTTAAIGAPGSYQIIWQVVSTDGHVVSDEYPFTWAPAGQQPVSVGSSTPPDCHGTASLTAPQASAAPSVNRESKANLGDVLWIGGAIVAVALAALVTILVLGRKKNTE
jgi:methionine-rich copper-binding protein CopC